MKIIGLITFIFLAQNIFATTKLVSHPTNYETVSASGTTVTLYAGLTDNTAIRSSCGSPGPCDTCALDTSAITTNSVCGKAEVLTTDSVAIKLNITGSSLTTAAEGKICLDTNCSSGVSSPSYTAYAAGSDLTISTTWAELCSLAGAGSSCAGSFSKSFYFGYKESSSSSLTEYVTLAVKFRYVVGGNTAYQSFNCDSPVDGEGFCFFDMYPGDKKAYILPLFNPSNSTGVVADFSGAANASDDSGMKYKYLRVLYLQGSGATDTQNTAPNLANYKQSMSHVDLPFDPATGDVSPKKISNLVNGNTYLFYTASVDQAGLVTNYAEPQYLCAANATYCPGCSTADQYATATTQCSTPQRVSGLLDGQECFIATATYGSSMAPEVESFRQFRGEYLLKSEIGKFFVRTYYKYSPPLAELISHSEDLKLLSRVFLFPILMFVKLSLLIGMLPALFVVLSLFSALVFGSSFWFARQRARSRVKA